MEQRLEPFVRHGTEEEPIEVSADEVLNAIAEGRCIDIRYAIINDELHMGMIADRLETGKDNIPIIKGNIRIRRCEFRGDVYSGSGVLFTEYVCFADSRFNLDFVQIG